MVRGQGVAHADRHQVPDTRKLARALLDLIAADLTEEPDGEEKRAS
jgi:hypothetical protein